MCKNINYEKVVKRINELFVTWRQNYIYQVKDGTYVDSKKFNGKLTDKEIEEHLRHKKTIGVKVNKVTKFILFDIDIAEDFDRQKFIVKKVKNSIQEFGIPKEFIYTVDSGSKGYHCILFFDDAIPLTYLKTLYNYVLKSTECNIHEIELRPTNQGVKLPLSINKKSGRVCYFVDDKFKPIMDEDFILGIKQYSSSILIEMVKDYENEHKQVNKLLNTVDKIFTKPESHKENIDSEYTFQKVEYIETNGIQFKGTRHNCLLKLGSMYNTLGYNQDEIENLLIEWMNKQDKTLYSTPYEKCLIDIKEISKYVINNNIQMTTEVKEVGVCKDEILKIIDIKGNKGKLVMYSLLIHSKRYANKTGIFYMTYNQIMKSCGITSKTTISKYLDELEKMEYIEIVRRNKYNEKLPNQYIVKIAINEINKDYTVNENVIDFNNSFNKCMTTIFNKQELKKMFSRREYERIVS